MADETAGEHSQAFRRAQAIAYDRGWLDGTRWAAGKADHPYENPYGNSHETQEASDGR